MRTSIILAAIIGTPVLIIVTACGSDSTKPDRLRGTVTEKEIEPAEYGKRKVNVKKKTCTYSRLKKRNVCTTKVKGTKTVTYLKKAKCYELDIEVKSGREVEVCNKDAYRVLEPNDSYDSGHNYSKDVAR